MGKLMYVGPSSFLGQSEVPAAVYEWQAPSAYGELSVRFLSPINERSRRFFVEALLDKLRGVETDFVHAACQYGFGVLQRHDGQQAERAQLHVLFSSLFRHRSARQTGNANKFNDLRDFVAMFTTERPRLILPGLADCDDVALAGESAKAVVRKLLQRAIVEQGGSPSNTSAASEPRDAEHSESVKIRTSSDVLCHYQRLLVDPVARQSRAPCIPVDSLPIARSELDVVIIDGVEVEQTDENPLGTGTVDLWAVVAMTKVGAALIADARLLEAANVAMRDQDRFATFSDALPRRRQKSHRRSLTAGSRTPAEGDLLPCLKVAISSRVPHGTKHAIGAERFIRSLWSYLWMGRCYGATMLLAWLDACDDLQLTAVESCLFRQMHLPQLHLGCLPLAFLEPQHQRWIHSPLVDLWNAGRFEPADYKVVTDLLVVYAELSERRREADRRIKSERGVYVRTETFQEWHPPDGLRILNSLDHDDLSEARREAAVLKAKVLESSGEPCHADQSVFLAGVPGENGIDPEQIPLLTSKACDECGAGMVPHEIVDNSHAEWMIVDLFCRRCDDFRRVRIAR